MENLDKNTDDEEEKYIQLFLTTIFDDLIQDSKNEELKNYLNNVENKTEWMKKFEKYLAEINYSDSNISALDALSKYTGIKITEDEFRNVTKRDSKDPLVKCLKILKSI